MKLAFLIATTVAGVASISPKVAFIKQNVAFCPKGNSAEGAVACLKQLSLLPEVFVHEMWRAMKSGMTMGAVSKLANAIIADPTIIEECVLPEKSIKDVHMCMLSSVGLNEYYVSTFESLEDYNLWADWAPFDLQSWIYEPGLLPYFPDNHWSMAGFVRAVKNKASPKLQQSLETIRINIEQNHSLVQIFDGLYAKPKLEAMENRQRAIAKVMSNYRRLIQLTPAPRDVLPERPSHLIPFILLRFSSKLGLGKVLAHLRDKVEIWENLSPLTVQAVFKKINDALPNEEAAGDYGIFAFDGNCNTSMNSPLWESTLLNAIWRQPNGRRSLIEAVVKSEKAPEALVDELSGTYSERGTMNSYVPILLSVRNKVTLAMIELLKAKRLDETLLRSNTIDYNTLIALWDDHWQQLASLFEKRRYIQMRFTPKQFKFYFVNSILETDFPSLEAAIVLVRPQINMLSMIYDTIKQIGFNKFKNDTDRIWDLFLVFKDQNIAKGMALDLKTIFKIEEQIDLEKGIAHLRQQIYSSTVQKFIQTAGANFKDISFPGPSLMPHWCRYFHALNEMLKVSRHSALWLALHADYFQASSDSFDDLKSVLTNLQARCSVSGKLDKFETSLVSEMMIASWMGNSRLTQYFDSLSSTDVSSLARTEDPCTKLRTVLSSDILSSMLDVQYVAEGLARENDLVIKRRAQLKKLSGNVYQQLLTFFRDSKNVEGRMDQYLESVLDSKAILKQQEDNTAAEEDDCCSICLNDFSDHNNPPRALKECKHIFHYDCITKAFKSNPRCPLCRGDIKSKSKKRKTQ